MSLGRLSLTPIRLVILVAFVGSIAFIGYAVLRVRNASQIPMMSSGFLVLGLAFTAVAIRALVPAWGAAAPAHIGRAAGAAPGGGAAGRAALRCFPATRDLAP